MLCHFNICQYNTIISNNITTKIFQNIPFFIYIFKKLNIRNDKVVNEHCNFSEVGENEI